MRLFEITYPGGPLGSFRQRQEWLRKLSRLPASPGSRSKPPESPGAGSAQPGFRDEDMELLRWV